MRVVALAAGCGLAGFLIALLIFGSPWHLPPDWGDIPTWIAVAVASIGGGIALSQLRQQQMVIQGEIARNQKRDDLVDGQLRELADRERSRHREQAELIDTAWHDPESVPGTSVVLVINNSHRPVRNATCQLFPDESGDPVDPDYGMEMNLVRFPVEEWVLPDKPAVADKTIESLRGGGRAGFVFLTTRADSPGGYAKVVFTDDATRIWALYSDLSLSPANPSSKPIAGQPHSPAVSGH
jgi:hypothetical protein